MKGPRRRSWADMDDDAELLLEQIHRCSDLEQRGPIAEFLAKKDAEQARKTGWNSRMAPAALPRVSWQGGDRRGRG